MLIAAGFAIACTNKKETHPNIVLILIDDMDWKDFGEAGSKYYELDMEGKTTKSVNIKAANAMLNQE